MRKWWKFYKNLSAVCAQGAVSSMFKFLCTLVFLLIKFIFIMTIGSRHVRTFILQENDDIMSAKTPTIAELGDTGEEEHRFNRK